MTNGAIVKSWVENNRPSARSNPQRTIFWIGDTIYSYGRHFPMARKVNDNIILFNTRRYSVTTAKHKSIVWMEICRSGKFKVFEVVSLDGDISHLANIANYKHELEVAYTKLSRAKKCHAYYNSVIRAKSTELQDYIRAFNIDYTVSINI